MEDLDCDVIVLGMGTCGEDAALRLAGSGLDVVGIEASLIGGECAYWACLPTKWLIRTANLLTEARRAHGLVGEVDVRPDWNVVAEDLRSQVTGGWQDQSGAERFEARGGRLIRGVGRITGPRRVEVANTSIAADVGVLVASGSRPRIPPIPGLAEAGYWTNHEAIEAQVLPDRLLILGGGPIGCELGQLFARFGVTVTVVEGRDRLLAGEEPESSHQAMSALESDGVAVIVGRTAARVERRAGEVTLTLDDGSVLTTDEILIATGRSADADELGAAAAGATVTNGFIEVGPTMRAAGGMWAIGDVTGKALLTEVALYQGTIAVEDLLGMSPPPANYDVIPRIVFTDPEIAAVGMTERQAREQGLSVRVVEKDLGSTFRGWLHRTGNSGFVKLVIDEAENSLVGASVTGPRAGDVIGMLALAVQEGTRIESLGRMIYGFPTFYGAVGEMTGAYGRGLVQVLDPGTSTYFTDSS